MNLVTQFQAHDGPVLALSYDIEGEYIISGGQDKLITLSHSIRGKTITTYTGHTADIFAVVPSSDQKNIFSCGIEKYVFVWDVANRRILRRLPGHNSAINCLALFPHTDDILLSGSNDSTIRVWDLRSFQRAPIQILNEAKDSVTSLSTGHSSFISGSADGVLRKYDIRKGEIIQIKTYPLEKEKNKAIPITCVTFCEESNVAIASSLDQRIQLFDLETTNKLTTCIGHINRLMKSSHVLLEPDGRYLISGSEDNYLYGWDLEENRTTNTSIEDDDNFTLKSEHLRFPALQVAKHPHIAEFAAGSLDGIIRIFSIS